MIKIDKLDMSLQTRASTDAETAEQYAAAMQDGVVFPAITVFTDGSHFWLADGFHRVVAAKMCGLTELEADIRKGTETDAVVWGGKANNKQGKRPTRADQRHYLEMVWERREEIFGGTPTGGNLAKVCGIAERTGRNFVNDMLAWQSLCEPATRQNAKLPESPTVLIGANDRQYPAPKFTRPERVAAVPEKPHTAKIPVDRFGVEIYPQLQEAFNGAGKVADVARVISTARCAIRNAQADGDIAFSAVRQEALFHLDNAYNFVTSAEAYCVCRICRGQGCKACHMRGWQTEEEYGRNPKEFRAQGAGK